MINAIMELKAIWLDQKLPTNKGATKRIAPGMMIPLNGDRLDYEGLPNAEVKHCMGTVSSSLLFFRVVKFGEVNETIVQV